MLIVYIILLALAITLWIVGRVGKRIDNHPLCIKCGFDLFNRSPSSTNCPECGSQLRAGATRLGNRTKRPWAIRAAWCVAIPALFFLAHHLYTLAKSSDFIQHLPLMVLRWDFEAPTEKESDAAFAEIRRRHSAGQLSKSETQSFVDTILDWQRDPAHRWDDRYAEFILAASTARDLTTAQWERFVRQSIVIELKVRPTLEHGRTFTLWQYFHSRLPQNSENLFSGTLDFELARSGKKSWFCSGADLQSFVNAGKAIESSTTQWAAIAAGPTTLEFTYDGVLTVGSHPPVSVRGTVSQNVTILPPGTPAVRLLRSPPQLAEMIRTIKIRSPFSPNSTDNIVTWSPSRTSIVDFDVIITDIRTPCYFKATVVQGGSKLTAISRSRTWEVSASRAIYTHNFEFESPTTPSPGSAELILTPDPDRAYDDTNGPEEIWGEELRIPVTVVAPNS